MFYKSNLQRHDDDDHDADSDQIRCYSLVIQNLQIITIILGIISNFVCTVTLSLIIVYNMNVSQSRSHIYKYFLIKSILELVNFLCIMMLPFYDCENCDLGHSYGLQVWYMIGYSYLSSTFLLASGFFEVLATLDCLISIKGHFNWWNNKKTFYFNVLTVLTFCAVFNVFKILDLRIHDGAEESFNLNQTHDDSFGHIEHFYHIENTDLSDTIFIKTVKVINIILTDYFIIIVLISINTFVFYFLKQATRRKQDLGISLHNAALKHAPIDTAAQAQKRKVVMISLLTLNYFIGHAPLTIHNLPIHANTHFWACYHDAFYILFNISYTTPIFFYYFFNTNFKKVLRKLFNLKITNRVEEGTHVTI
jgi:hypothetical protein